MGTGHRHPHLRAFVLGSLAVHGLLLVVWTSSVQFGAEPRVSLSVRLDGDHKTTPVGRKDSALRPPTERIERAPAPAAEPVPVTAQAGGERETARAAPTTSAVATGNDDVVRARIEAQLRTDLARHFDYPWLARLRGWEGGVLLAFIVRAGGSLNDVRVVRSSGFAVLDRSAVDSLQKIERIPEAVAWLQGRDIEMQLPIVYHLKGER